MIHTGRTEAGPVKALRLLQEAIELPRLAHEFAPESYRACVMLLCSIYAPLSQ